MTEPLPAKVLQLGADERPQLVWTNERGGTTYQAGTRFIKWSPHTTRLDLDGERRRLEWAAPYHNVPRVLEWGSNDEAQWLVTAALAGTGAVMEPWISQPLVAARAIGRGLRMLHEALPVAECPFEWSPENRTGRRVPWAELGVPPIDRLVVCHGDPCSPNTIIGADGSPIGHVDLGSLGIADRWADLAVASINLDYNYGPGWEQEFFRAYDIEPDPRRIAYYRFLWDNEDRIGVSPEAARDLRASYSSS
ncbi:aminoglycoside 3'-phosphotransferase [Steroidobacter agaridevorans]|uniref:aminoglycoside 3'-phosphotransferase n=1 Tax=Steroidobacter agaridevorans TaxID=2695856 RepID=UPI001320C459|nr:aminoglycoside 3'-phosphotransferase [Steroidobacter agaridevorans]GFE88994.1 aminoglycoside phosphotransferase APH(3') [Steroidobacter agaridevorans]